MLCHVIALLSLHLCCVMQVHKRVKEYKVKLLNDMRPGKKLLVLDIDYTLFDHRSTAETGAELMRPYLHEFLTSAYKVWLG